MHKSDDDFLCKTNDRIDNAVYAVICAVAAGEDAKDTIQAAIDTIACDKYVVIVSAHSRDFSRELAET